jgi:hypothetical protein
VVQHGRVHDRDVARRETVDDAGQQQQPERNGAEQQRETDGAAKLTRYEQRPPTEAVAERAQDGRGDDLAQRTTGEQRADGDCDERDCQPGDGAVDSDVRG